MNHYLKEEKDETLVDLTLLGNDAAYEELVIRYGKLVNSVAYRITGNKYSAEDAAQDAFVSAWMKLDTLNEREKFSSWVCRIAGNTAKNIAFHYRNTAADISLDLVSYFESEECGEPEITLVADSENEELREAVEALTEKIRETVKLHYFDGYSVKEIAEMLSLPAGTVTWRLSEGRKQLRKGYGIMEKTVYDENESLEKRVLRQIDELRKSTRKNDRSGFENDYREVLAAVESLSNTDKKNFMLAEVLTLGYWFLPGAKNDETFRRIKEAVEASHNDEVMQAVLAVENNKYRRKAALDFMRGKIDALRAGGYRLALGYEIFWYAAELLTKHDRCDEAFAEFRKVTEVLDPSDVYYASAVGAIKAAELCDRIMVNGDCMIGATGNLLEKDGDKLYFTDLPGFLSEGSGLFCGLGMCDRMVLDSSMKPGDTFVASDGESAYTVKSSSENVTVPAGTFGGCILIEVCKADGCAAKAWIAPGVGIVKAEVKRWSCEEWVLTEFTCTDNSSGEIIPFDVGNRWKFSLSNRDKWSKWDLHDIESIYEVVYADDKKINISQYEHKKPADFNKSTVDGNCAFIRAKYVKNGDDAGLCNRDEVYASLDLMQKASKTDYERKFASAFADVTKRIFETDEKANPDYTEKGVWNFFNLYRVVERECEKKIIECSVHIEWKDTRTMDFDGTKLLHAFLLSIWSDDIGCLWSDKFVPGYTENKNVVIFADSVRREITVGEDETVTTAAGTFEGCRHIHVQIDGLSRGLAYFGGCMDFWFAPGVGLVRYERATDCERDNVFELTSYEGTGEGYFPAAAGLFRRYEPTDLRGGWHSSVEHTYAEKDGEIRIIENILGTRDRKQYEESLVRLGLK